MVCIILRLENPMSRDDLLRRFMTRDEKIAKRIAGKVPDHVRASQIKGDKAYLNLKKSRY